MYFVCKIINGQLSNNDGDLLWNYLKRGTKLNCFICFDLNFNAHILEAKLIELKNKNSKKKHVINLNYVQQKFIKTGWH